MTLYEIVIDQSAARPGPPPFLISDPIWLCCCSLVLTDFIHLLNSSVVVLSFLLLHKVVVKKGASFAYLQEQV